MRLDSSIIKSLVAFGSLVLFCVVVNWIEHKWNPRPPRERYRKDGGLPWVAVWNMFDASRFTPEAIRFHQRRLAATPVVLVAAALWWALITALW